MITLITLLVLAGNGSPPPEATEGRRGLVVPGPQTFSGRKTFIDGGVAAESLTVLSGSSDGGFDVLTATKSTITLYVDVDGGNDSSTCTGGDAGACLTVNGALSKLPRFINHDTTVNVAAGTYAGVTLSNFYIAGGVTFRVTGAALANSTLRQGSATGTVTYYDAGLFPLQASITDSTQTLPTKFSTNDVYYTRGTFLTLVAPDAGTQTRIVTATNGTDIELLSAFTTAPSPGWTYSFQEPSTVFAGDGGYIFTISDVHGQVTLTNLKFAPPSPSTFFPSILTVAARPASGLRLSTSFVFVRETDTNIGTSASLGAPDAVYSFANSTFAGGNNSATITTVGANSLLSLNTVYAGGQRGLVGCVTSRTCSMVTAQFDSRNITSNQAVAVGPSANLFSVWINCTSRAAAGALFGGVNGIVASGGWGVTTLFNVAIDGCGNGIVSQGNNITATGGTLKISNVNSDNYLVPTGGGINITRGTFVDLSAATLSYSAVGFDAGVTYIVGGTEVNDATLAAMPDGGQFFQNFQGTIFRR